MRIAFAVMLLLSGASAVAAQPKKEIKVTPTVEMIQADGSPVDLVKIQDCQKNVAMQPRDWELSQRSLAKDERLPTVDFANTFRRTAAFYECLDRLGYVMRSRVVLPK